MTQTVRAYRWGSKGSEACRACGFSLARAGFVNVGNSRERNREFRSSFPPAEDQTNSIMVTRHRRRGYSPRYLGDVGEPETEAHLRAERKVRIQSPPAASQQRTVPAGQLALVGPGIPSSGPAWQALAVSIAYSRKITGSL